MRICGEIANVRRGFGIARNISISASARRQAAGIKLDWINARGRRLIDNLKRACETLNVELALHAYAVVMAVYGNVDDIWQLEHLREAIARAPAVILFRRGGGDVENHYKFALIRSPT